jgi:hypothetical protein
MKRRRLFTLATLGCAVAVAASAWAFWSATGIGVASGAAASMAPATISVPASATNSVTVTWSAQASLVPAAVANSQITYTIERRLGAGAYAAVTSGTCAGAQAYGTTSCTDNPPSSGTYTYRAVANFNSSWTSTSADTNAVVVTVDTTPPVVSSITRLDTDPTNAATVRWTVTFSESVTGVGTADFALSQGGTLSGAAITGVTGSGSAYIVTASTGTGTGALGLNLVDDDSIADAAANKLGGAGAGNGNFTGQTYSIDRTGPAATSIVTAVANPTNATTVSWTVTFSEAATGVDAGDFVLVRTGTVSANSAISSVTGGGTTYTVTATTASGEGTLGLNFTGNGTVVDALGNTATGAFTGAACTIDRTAPARTALQMLDTNANGKVDQIKVTFNETLASSTATTPWTLASVPSGGTLASVSTSGTVATLTIAEGAGAADTTVGSLTVALAASAAGIHDPAGNQASFAAAAPTDLAAPAPTSIQMFDIDVDGKIDRLTATFSETLAATTATTPWTLANVPSGGTLASVSRTGAVATLVITEGAGTAATGVGTFTVALTASATGVRDAAGNQSAFAAVAPVDKASPLPLLVGGTNGTTDGKIETGDTFAVTFTEPMAPASVPASTPITEADGFLGNDKLTIGSITNGALDMSSGNYVSLFGTVNFAGTSAVSGAVITTTSGACSSGCGSATAGNGTSMVYVPATTLTDVVGNAVAGSVTSAIRIF